MKISFARNLLYNEESKARDPSPSIAKSYKIIKAERSICEAIAD